VPRLLRRDTLLPLLLLAVTVAMVIYPLAMVLYGSVRDTAPGQPGAFTLENWRTVLADPSTFQLLATSILIAVPRTVLALLLATIFAWCLARTTTPGKRLLEGLLVFLFFLPELPWVLAWMLLGAPNVGLLNQWLRLVVPGMETFVNVYSYGGLIVLGAVRSAPVLFLFVYPAFQAMDATLEEAARMAGASAWRTIWRIDLPLLLPALLASGILSFVVAMEAFEIPQLLGTPAKIFVFTTRIYDLAYGGHVARFGPAMVLAVLLLLLTVSLIAVQWKILKGRAYTTISGRGYQARPLDLGAWRWVPFAAIMTFFAVFGALPFVVLLLNSFMELSGFSRGRCGRPALDRRAVAHGGTDVHQGHAGRVGHRRDPGHDHLGADLLRRDPHALGGPPGPRHGRVGAVGGAGPGHGAGISVGLRVAAHLRHAVAAGAGVRGARAAGGLAVLHRHDGPDRRRARGIRAHPRRLLAADLREDLGAAPAAGHPGGLDPALRGGRAGPGSRRAARRPR
jgi:ABC-type spermidine/putrescine transport system permease subunit I